MYTELTQFKNWLKCQYSGSSASVHYSSDLALFFSFIKKPPSTIIAQDVDRYILHSRQQRYSPSTINRRLSALRTFYYFLSITCDTSPVCPILPRHRLRKAYPLPRDVSDSDIETLFAAINNLRDKAIFHLMLDSGLRVGEVCRLSLADIVFENPPHLLVNGKGRKQRIVYLSPPIQEILRRCLVSRPVTKDRAVFISEHGKRLSVAGIQYLLRCYCEKAGVHFTCHQLRHTFGRRMAEANLPLTSLQSLLGHKSVRTTQIYVHLSNTHLQNEYDRAISQVVTASSSNTTVTRTKRQSISKPREINWNGYLGKLPEWLADLIRAYCSQCFQAIDPIQQTRNRLSQLSRFLQWMLSNDPHFCLKSVTPKIWFSYVEMRLTTSAKPASLNTTLRILQSLLIFARDTNHSVCERMLDVRPLKTGDLLPRDITQAQLNEILRQADPFDYAWILLMAHCGLRTCEIRSLCWHNIDLKHRILRIEESKGLHSRIVFLSSPTLNAIRRLPQTTEFIFTLNNQPLSNRYCQSRLKIIAKSCKVQITPHQLRHTCGTILLNAGMSVFGVQAILGHKHVDTTLRYARIYDSEVAQNYKQAVQVLQQNEVDLPLK